MFLTVGYASQSRLQVRGNHHLATRDISLLGLSFFFSLIASSRGQKVFPRMNSVQTQTTHSIRMQMRPHSDCTNENLVRLKFSQATLVSCILARNGEGCHATLPRYSVGTSICLGITRHPCIDENPHDMQPHDYLYTLPRPNDETPQTSSKILRTLRPLQEILIMRNFFFFVNTTMISKSKS